MKKYLMVLVALALFLGTSCQPKHKSEADKLALIKLCTEDYDANFLSGNPDASVELYTETAVRIQYGEVYSGKEAIRSRITKVRKGFTISTHEKTLEDAWISGDLGTVRGTFTGSLVHAEWGDTLYSKNAWVDVCERQEDGSWKMVFTMVTELRD